MLVIEIYIFLPGLVQSVLPVGISTTVLPGCTTVNIRLEMSAVFESLTEYVNKHDLHHFGFFVHFLYHLPAVASNKVYISTITSELPSFRNKTEYYAC